MKFRRLIETKKKCRPSYNSWLVNKKDNTLDEGKG
jgi:hypothetical protein